MRIIVPKRKLKKEFFNDQEFIVSEPVGGYDILTFSNPTINNIHFILDSLNLPLNCTPTNTATNFGIFTTNMDANVYVLTFYTKDSTFTEECHKVAFKLAKEKYNTKLFNIVLNNTLPLNYYLVSNKEAIHAIDKQSILYTYNILSNYDPEYDNNLNLLNCIEDSSFLFTYNRDEIQYISHYNASLLSSKNSKPSRFKLPKQDFILDEVDDKSLGTKISFTYPVIGDSITEINTWNKIFCSLKYAGTTKGFNKLSKEDRLLKINEKSNNFLSKHEDIIKENLLNDLCPISFLKENSAFSTISFICTSQVSITKKISKLYTQSIKNRSTIDKIDKSMYSYIYASYAILEKYILSMPSLDIKFKKGIDDDTIKEYTKILTLHAYGRVICDALNLSSKVTSSNIRNRINTNIKISSVSLDFNIPTKIATNLLKNITDNTADSLIFDSYIPPVKKKDPNEDVKTSIIDDITNNKTSLIDVIKQLYTDEQR